MRTKATIQIMGFLSANSEMTFVSSGKARLKFRVPHNPRVQAGTEEHTNWYACTIIGPRAETLAPMLTKGTPVQVTGTLDVREYKGNDGSTRYSLDIFVNDVDLLGSRSDAQAAPAQAAAPAANADLFPGDDTY